MNYLRYIPYIIILFFICYIGYKEYRSNNTQNDLKSEIIKLQKEIRDSETRQYNANIKLINELNEAQHIRFEEMQNEIDKINTNIDNNNVIIAKLHNTTHNVSENWDSYSNTKQVAYIRTINDKYNELAKFASETAGIADRNYEYAVTYYNMLSDIYTKSNVDVTVDDK